MTAAELQSLCHRHEIPPRDAQMALDRIESALVPPSPVGIGLKRERVSSLMETIAQLNGFRNMAPYNECEFCETGERVVRLLRDGDFE